MGCCTSTRHKDICELHGHRKSDRDVMEGWGSYTNQFLALPRRDRLGAFHDYSEVIIAKASSVSDAPVVVKQEPPRRAANPSIFAVAIDEPREMCRICAMNCQGFDGSQVEADVRCLTCAESFCTLCSERAHACLGSTTDLCVDETHVIQKIMYGVTPAESVCSGNSGSDSGVHTPNGASNHGLMPPDVPAPKGKTDEGVEKDSFDASQTLECLVEQRRLEELERRQLQEAVWNDKFCADDFVKSLAKVPTLPDFTMEDWWHNSRHYTHKGSLSSWQVFCAQINNRTRGRKIKYKYLCKQGESYEARNQQLFYEQCQHPVLLRFRKMIVDKVILDGLGSYRNVHTLSASIDGSISKEIQRIWKEIGMYDHPMGAAVYAWLGGILVRDCRILTPAAVVQLTFDHRIQCKLLGVPLPNEQ